MTEEKYETFLETDRIILRGTRENDFSHTMATWINSKEVTRFLSRGILPVTIDSLKEEYWKSIKDPNAIQLAIVDKKSSKYIGITGLHSLNWLARHGEFRILIGEVESWGKGFGTEAVQMMIAFGFLLLNLNKIWLGVNKENSKATSSYLKAGFKIEGELRDELYRNGKYHTIIRMSILRNEFNEVRERWLIHKFIEQQMDGEQV